MTSDPIASGKDSPQATPLLQYSELAKAGILPVKRGAVRFAVGSPDNITSNSWKIWVNGADVYIACRDNMKETKVSLHASGRWRMGFTSEAYSKLVPNIRPPSRVWEVWDEPSVYLPNTVRAFQLVFPTTELAVRPDQRACKLWKDAIYIEAAPLHKLTVVRLFITIGEPKLVHDSEPSFCLCSLQIPEGRRAQVIAHSEPLGNFMDLIEKSISCIHQQVNITGVSIPEQTYAYTLGSHSDGCRFLVGARVNRGFTLQTSIDG